MNMLSPSNQQNERGKTSEMPIALPSLLDLPPEIRQQIYDIVFCDALIQSQAKSDNSATYNIWRIRTQILATCKLIHEEATPRYQGKLKFVLHSWPDIANLPRISLFLQLAVYELTTKYPEPARLKTFMKTCANRFPNLKVVTFHVETASLFMSSWSSIEKCREKGLRMRRLAATEPELVGRYVDLSSGSFTWQPDASTSKSVQIRFHVMDCAVYVRESLADGTSEFALIVSSLHSDGLEVTNCSQLCIPCWHHGVEEIELCCSTHFIEQQRSCFLCHNLKADSTVYGAFPDTTFEQILRESRGYLDPWQVKDGNCQA